MLECRCQGEGSLETFETALDLGVEFGKKYQAVT